jgi:hypothetical protein
MLALAVATLVHDLDPSCGRAGLCVLYGRRAAYDERTDARLLLRDRGQDQARWWHGAATWTRRPSRSREQRRRPGEWAKTSVATKA